MFRFKAAFIFLAMTLVANLGFGDRPDVFPAGTHPFDPEIQKAHARIASMKREIQDYSCIFTKRERVKGKLLGYEQIAMRVRHNPFSVYMYWLSPDGTKGQQAVYIEGRNDGKMIAQPVGALGIGGPYHLKPTGPFAMKNQRYPITNAGMLKMMEQLVVEAQGERKYGETTVKYYQGAKVDGSVCTVTEVTHPKRQHFLYHMARIYVDDQLQLPIRLETYLWPPKAGDPLPVLEEYTYTKIKLNNGFTDADFVIRKGS
jgi:hypothetical protein